MTAFSLLSSLHVMLNLKLPFQYIYFPTCNKNENTWKKIRSETCPGGNRVKLFKGLCNIFSCHLLSMSSFHLWVSEVKAAWSELLKLIQSGNVFEPSCSYSCVHKSPMLLQKCKRSLVITPPPLHHERWSWIRCNYFHSSHHKTKVRESCSFTITYNWPLTSHKAEDVKLIWFLKDLCKC